MKPSVFKTDPGASTHQTVSRRRLPVSVFDSCDKQGSCFIYFFF